MAGDIPIEQPQVYEFHPEYNLKEDDAVLSHLDPQPSPFASFVLPAFRFYRLLGMCPSSFKFDKETRKFVHVRGSWMRRVISVVLGAVIALQCYGMSKALGKHLENTTISAMQNILGICYIFFILIFFRAFLVNGEVFKEIFDALQHAHKLTAQLGSKLLPIWKIRLASSSLMLCCIGIAVWNTFGIFHIGVNASSDTNLYTYLEKFADAELGVVNYIMGQDGNSTTFFNFDGPIKVTLGLISFLLLLWGSLCWGGAILMNSLWGLMFWLLLRQFFQAVSNISTRNTLKDIRHFNAITAIIDKYNEACGWVILCSILSGAIHFSMNVFVIFNEKSGQSNRALALVEFLWFGLMLISCAQVHKTACDIVQVIKSRFQAENVWIQKHGNCNETTQGMTLILHEIQTNSIGFKGLGFFTCTYGFIGTVLSAITTYAVIVLQFEA